MFRVFCLAFLFFGCATETTTDLVTCELALNAPDEDLIAAETIVVSGGPFTAILDSSVRFDQHDAEILSVDRDDCTLCYSCREQALCSTCDTCETCDLSCETCVETMTLVIPDLPTGTYNVTARNSYGMSSPTPLLITQFSSVDESD
jgi:ferredoxin